MEIGALWIEPTSNGFPKMSSSKKQNSRRSFLNHMGKGLLGVGLAPVVVSAQTKEKEARTLALQREQLHFDANDQIQVALIGAGGMGISDARVAASVPGVKIVAACDLYDGRLQEAKKIWGKDIFTTRSYQEIVDRSDIDAVIIATPDHWHKDISVAAMNKKKAVYCEKPMIHHISEGPAVLEAQKKNGVIFEVGSQGMSSLGNEKARQLYLDGAIGKLNYAEGFWARMSPTGAWQYPIPKDASLQNVGWDAFVSNTQKRAYDPLRFFRWRNYKDYGTGVSGDLFVHLFSSLHFVTGSVGPNKIMATGGLRFWNDGREVPDVMLGMFDYPETKAHPAFNLSLRVNFVDGTGGTNYLRMVGSEGSMTVEWDKVTLYRNKSQVEDPLLASKLQEQDNPSAGKTYVYDRKSMQGPDELIYAAEKGYKGAHFDHFYNMFQAMRTGGKVQEDALFGYRAAAPALLCNDSYFGNKIIQWNPDQLKLV